MADQHAVAAATHGGGGGHATVKTYINVAIVLAIITAVEVASLYIPGIPGSVLVISLLAMSAAKFALVAMFFMHLRYDARPLTAVFVGPLLIATGLAVALMTLTGAFLVFGR